MFQAFRGIVTLTITRQRMMIACVTLLTLAMHAVLMPASAQDLRAIHKRFLQFKAAGNYGEALIEAQKLEAAVEARLGTAHRDYAVALQARPSRITI